MNNIYLTSYYRLEKGCLQKYAGPDVTAKNSRQAIQKLQKKSRLPLEVDGKLICKIRK